MTQEQYLRLKATLVQGCSIERFDFLCMMTPRQRAEFAVSLTLAPSDHLVTQTWQMLATLIASDVLDMINQPALCADPFGCEGDCTPCEMKMATSPAELAATTEATLTTDNLQGAL